MKQLETLGQEQIEPVRRRVALKAIKLGKRGILSLLVGALSVGLPLAGAPPELPATPAGKVLAGYLEAVNSGNKDKLEAFIKAHRPDRPDALGGARR